MPYVLYVASLDEKIQLLDFVLKRFYLFLRQHFQIPIHDLTKSSGEIVSRNARLYMKEAASTSERRH